MFIGSRDVLRDQCLKFTKILRDCNRTVECIIFEEMYHGFLNYASKSFGYKEATKCIEIIGNKISDFFEEKMDF